MYTPIHTRSVIWGIWAPYQISLRAVANHPRTTNHRQCHCATQSAPAAQWNIVEGGGGTISIGSGNSREGHRLASHITSAVWVTQVCISPVWETHQRFWNWMPCICTVFNFLARCCMYTVNLIQSKIRPRNCCGPPTRNYLPRNNNTQCGTIAHTIAWNHDTQGTSVEQQQLKLQNWKATL